MMRPLASSAPDGIAPEIIALEKRARKYRLVMTDVLRAQGIAPSTWWRWRAGRAEPSLSKLRQVERAIAEAAKW